MTVIDFTERTTDDLKHEHWTLCRDAANGALDAEQAAQRDALYAELARRAATPPDGYSLPRAATDLLAAAEAAGWKHLVQWQKASDDMPFVTVQVGREVTAEERAELMARGFRGDHWKFAAAWHGRGARPGCVKLFGQVRSKTPESSEGTTSIKQAIAVITADGAARPQTGGA